IIDQGDPFAVNDTGTTTENTLLTTVNVTSNDTYVDDATISSFDDISFNGGIIVAGSTLGTFDYTPPTSFIGLDTFTYTICDDDSPINHCSTATVKINVLPGTT
ncbi:Ig-like domain-containing protein, partial [Jejuia spongiicola]